MTRSVATVWAILTAPGRRRSLLRRSAPIWFGLIVTAGSMVPPPPEPGLLPQIAKIPVTFAGYPCSSHSGEWTTFTGHLSNSSGTLLSESTSGDVYGRISNVDREWQASPGCGYYRYDGIIWATTDDTTHLRVDWGALSGDAQPCLYFLNSADYIHANSGACPGSPTTARLVATLTPEGTYHNDGALDDSGAFALSHADCITWYNAEVVKTGASTSVTSGEPGANCGNKQIDNTSETQSLVFDGTAPTISFSYPAAGGPVGVPSASAAVTFSATDALAGFSGTDDWTLTRETATWSGSVCGTFAADSGTKATVNGTTNAANQVSSQGLQLNKCYRWKLTATDKNGNTASTITSGSIRTDTSGVLGDQPQFGMESWDLGGGDTLAVSTGSGNLRLTHPIVSLPMVGGTFDLAASYNSHDTASIGMGPGWRLNVQRRLTVNGDGSVTLTDSDGSRHTFTSPTGSPTVTYTRPATLYATLTRDTAATPDRFTLTYRDQSVDIFDEDITGTGLLKQVKDRNGNTTSIAYTAGTANISTITDPSSRTVAFTWTGSNLTQIVDWANVSSGIVQTSGSGNRTHRFFYDGSNNLIGWADPLNTSGSCPSGGSHLTCLTNTSGFLTAIAKTQTYETFSAGTLGSATRTVSTAIAYEFADVASVTDAEAGATTFTHAATGATTVTRPGTPASATTYTLVSATDAYGRIGSVKRKLGAAQVETATTYNATYPIEAAAITENKGGGALERTTNYTYQASSLALVSRLDEPLDGTYRRYSDFTYNANNDVTSKNVYSTDAATDHTETRYCYTTSGCSTSATDLLLRSMIENYVDGTAGGSNGHIEDVITAYTYDAAGQRTRQTRSNYSGSTLLDSAATGWTYDSSGDVTAEIRNYANGSVANPGDDITPNGTTNARTDLTTAYTYDTAGNRVSTADPRRAIETALGTSLGTDDYISRTVFDALNQDVISRLPTTPGISDCGSPPGCREATTTYDELGQVREAADINDLVTATKYDKAGRGLETYEDPAAAAAVTTSVSTYDASGRILTAKDQRQAASASLGYADYDYDELGRVTDVTEAAGSSPDLSSVTHTTYDNLNRRASEEVGYGTGTGQITAWTYDIGGRTTKADDEFTCATTTYDYRDLALTVVEGQASGSCSGSGLRTTTNTYDGKGRLTNTAITAGAGSGDVLAAPTYDAAGNQLSTSATTATVTTASTFTFNPLDQQVAETRSDAGTAVSWTKTNFDAVGNPTDRCVWNSPGPGSELCKVAGSSYTTTPATSSTSAYDARNQRVSLKIPSVGETTYDPAHNYQVAAIYVPTASGKEHQSLYTYDSLHRLTGITQQLCTISTGHSCSGTTSTGSDVYTYDDNDNRTRVNENNGNAGLDQYYCYDALNRLTSRGSTNCTTGTPESYEYDDAGNRTRATLSSPQYFRYSATGQLCEQNTSIGSCPADPNTWQIRYDTSGRTSQWNGWYLTYEGEGRLASACKVSGCATGDKVTMRYDAEGRRVELVTRPSGGSDTTTTFRYQGDAIAQELVAGTVTRTYVTDDGGAVVKFCDPDCSGSNPQYLVTWNGHGDAASIWKIDTTTGALTLANSFTYTTWGAPTTTTHNSIADLGFRFLYVGRGGVAWDNAYGLGLEYMSARHYSPALGRFLQPDPSHRSQNLYSYVGDNPVTKVDPSGLDDWWRTITKIRSTRLVVPWWYEGLQGLTLAGIGMVSSIAAAYFLKKPIDARVTGGTGLAWAFAGSYIGPDIKGGDVFTIDTWEYFDHWEEVTRQYRNGYLLSNRTRFVHKSTCAGLNSLLRASISGKWTPTGARVYVWC
jgi:RHS repeat-associated protein